MKITRINPWLVNAPSSFWGEYFFVEVQTDEGITGWGEITTTTLQANRAVAGIVRQLNDLIAGDDPAQIERIWHKIFRSFTYMGSRGATTHVISGIDIALWDIRGKALGLPIYELLGGKVRDDVLLYTHPNQRNFATDEGIEREIGEIAASGHTSIKFDPFPALGEQSRQNAGYLSGTLPDEGDRIAADLTRKIREAAGPDMELLIDAHGRFNVPTAIRLCNLMEQAGQVDWFEEPVPVESYNALRQVREKVNVPISVGERLHTRWEFVPIFENELADYVMPDVTWTGGITELKKIATMAEVYYIPVSPHDASGPINVVAGSHVMITTPNFYRVETANYDLSGYNQFIQEPLDNAGGTLKLPDRPGLGIDIDVDYFKANIVDGIGG
jgi:galactonate dehydratase